MCPACLTSFVLIAAGGGSAGGLAAVVVKHMRKKPAAKDSVRPEPADAPTKKENIR